MYKRQGHNGPKSKSGKFQEDSRKSRPSDRMRQEDEAGGPQDTGKAQEPEGSAEKAGSKKDKYQKACLLYTSTLAPVLPDPAYHDCLKHRDLRHRIWPYD